LSIWWTIPFIGLLLSTALGPLLSPVLCHKNFGKVITLWSLCFLIPCTLELGASSTAAGLLGILLTEYLPFIILLTTLFLLAGSICLRGRFYGTPISNFSLLLVGTTLASLMGTTGASMLLIRPLIYANKHRKNVAHIFIFFIFLVANAGGALSPLGDPPLFIGFLKGIDFSWTLKNIWGETIFICCSLLFIFYLLDCFYFYKYEDKFILSKPLLDKVQPKFEGKFNFILLLLVTILVLASGFWKSRISYNVFGTIIELQNLVRDAILLVIILVSLWATPSVVREKNGFSWSPLLEVAKIFSGIFITITPIIAMLHAKENSSLGFLLHHINNVNQHHSTAIYFWATGMASSFLDNAPTYLVFFNIASGNPVELMTELPSTLAAISCGAVFMGANSYIGNAPNLMIKAIVEESGIQMPSFFSYIGWSCMFLLPLFIAMTFIFFS